jgi:hypothetical protein
MFKHRKHRVSLVNRAWRSSLGSSLAPIARLFLYQSAEPCREVTWLGIHRNVCARPKIDNSFRRLNEAFRRQTADGRAAKWPQLGEKLAVT